MKKLLTIMLVFFILTVDAQEKPKQKMHKYMQIKKDTVCKVDSLCKVKCDTPKVIKKHR